MNIDFTGDGAWFHKRIPQTVSIAIQIHVADRPSVVEWAELQEMKAFETIGLGKQGPTLDPTAQHHD